MIVPKHYENLNVLHENTMPHRAYYMPASKDMGPLVHDREKSDRMELLNGNWKFQFYKSIYDLQEKFYEAGYDTKGFDEIPVPGIWQNYGYDSHQYTNVRYPIPLDPPYVPQENPCGAYVHQFEYKKDSKAPKAYLNFEGVDSCFYVWINGVYVGYSQVAHATSEFDVTDHLKEGTNTLAVLVLKWCDGTYLEDQDKFRMTGIFRDVYLLKRPESVLYDYFTTTSIGENGAEIEIRANFLGESNAAENTKIVIRNHEGNTVATGTFKKCDDENFAYKAVLDITNPVLWNPEQPYLYQVLFLSENEVIVDRIGIREIHCEGSVIYINDVKAKFKGVNRHEGVEVNTKMPEELRRVPFQNIIYVADGPSDIPAFSLVNKNHGATFAIYPHGDMKAMRQVEQMRVDGRINMYAEANYQEGTTAYMWICHKIKECAERIRKREREKISVYAQVGTPKHLT